MACAIRYLSVCRSPSSSSLFSVVTSLRGGLQPRFLDLVLVRRENFSLAHDRQSNNVSNPCADGRHSGSRAERHDPHPARWRTLLTQGLGGVTRRVLERHVHIINQCRPCSFGGSSPPNISLAQLEKRCEPRWGFFKLPSLTSRLCWTHKPDRADA